MSQYRLRSKELKVSELQKQLQHVNLNAAGIDVGSDRHLVAVPEGRDDVAVREFGAFTTDLHALANWLSKCGVTTVAMESTASIGSRCSSCSNDWDSKLSWSMPAE